MKSKSLLLILTTLIFTTSLPVASAAENLSIGIAYDIGGLGDKSFNDAAATGLKSAQKQFTFTVESVITDGSSTDRERRIRSLITKKCNPIIVIGAGYAPAIQGLAIEFPDTQFAILNDATVDALNVTSIVFADTQGAYLAGFAAAMSSKTGKVAMIAFPKQADIYQNGFAAGVASAKRRVTPFVKYVTGSSAAATRALIDSGVDIIYVSTVGSDSDVFNVIVSANTSKTRKKSSAEISMISVEPDQFIAVTSATRKYVVASVIKRIDKAIYDVISKSVNHSQYLDILDPIVGIYGHRYGIADKGIEFTTRSKTLTALASAINVAAATAEKIPA